jgi:anti-repressor protein
MGDGTTREESVPGGLEFAIIKSTISNDEVNTVNARELHESLQVKTKFSDWVKRRLDEGELSQGTDFIVLKIEHAGIIEKIDYYLTFDAAKHLALMERNDQGKLVRQYFIDFDKKAREVLPKQTFEEMVLSVVQGLQRKVEAQKVVIVEQEQKLEIARGIYQEQKPKADVYDQFMGSKNRYTFSEPAKRLSENLGAVIGANRRFQYLRDKGWLMTGERRVGGVVVKTGRHNIDTRHYLKKEMPLQPYF